MILFQLCFVRLELLLVLRDLGSIPRFDVVSQFTPVFTKLLRIFTRFFVVSAELFFILMDFLVIVMEFLSILPDFPVIMTPLTAVLMNLSLWAFSRSVIRAKKQRQAEYSRQSPNVKRLLLGYMIFRLIPLFFN